MNDILTYFEIKSFYFNFKRGIITLFTVSLLSCMEGNKKAEVIMDVESEIMKQKPNEIESKVFKYIALGDSYTIGEAVKEEESFPAQLSVKLESQFDVETQTKIIATTGWRTDELIQAIEDEKITEKFDFVTLLIGVNNQFQNRNFNQYKKEFVELLEIANDLVNGKKDKILVLSIPDYAFTPFGKGKIGISSGVDKYNTFAEEASKGKNIDFLNITDITRRGLKEPDLVAGDDLHISGLVYKEVVERILNLKFKNLKSIK